MLKIRLKFLTLSKDNLNDSLKSWDKHYFIKLKFNRKTFKISTGIYDEHLNLISWAHELLNSIQFNVISKCKSSKILFTLHEIKGEKFIGRIIFNLKSLLIDKESSSITETVCLDFEKSSGSDLLNDSKFVFDIITTNLSLDLFPSKPQVQRLKIGNQDLNVHLKFHELLVKENLSKQAFIRIKINNQYECSKWFKIDKNIKIDECFIIRIKFFELFEHFIEIHLIEEHHLFKHQNNILAEFSMLLHNIYVNFDKENHGFDNKFLFLSPNFSLKTSIFINSSDYLPINDENNTKSNILLNQISNERLRISRQFSLVFFYIELFNHITRFPTQISCKLKLTSNKHEIFLIDINNIKSVTEKDFIIICQEFVIQLKFEKISQVAFEFSTGNNKKLYSSIQFENLFKLTSYPLALKLCEDSNFEYPIGQILMKFEFLANNHENGILQINNVNCNVDELRQKYSKHWDYLFLIVLNGIYQLPVNLNHSLSVSLKILNQKTNSEYFYIENNKFSLLKSIKWQSHKPVLLVQFKLPNQIYRVLVLNFIDCLIDEISTKPPKKNIDIILKESFEKFKLIEINTADEIDNHIKNVFLNFFDKNFKEFENFSIQINLLKSLFQFVKTLTYLPLIRITLQKKENFKVKVLCKTFISFYNAYYSTFKAKHDKCFTLDANENNFFKPVADINAYCFSNQDDFKKCFKDNFSSVTLIEDFRGKLFSKNTSKIIEEFMFEIQIKSKFGENWETVFYMDKSLKKYEKKRGIINKDYLILKDWYREDEKWIYSNNFTQSIWLDVNIDSQLKYRCAKWIRKSSLKNLEAIESSNMNMISDTQLNKIFNSDKTLRISVIPLKSKKINYLLNIKFIEAKLLYNILLNLNQNIFKKDITNAFYSLKVFVFDKNKTLTSKRTSKNINISYLNQNPEWESNLEFSFEEFEQKSNTQIFFELFFNYLKHNRIKEISLGKSTIDYEFQKSEIFERTIINFHTKATGLVEFKMKQNENYLTYNQNPEIKKVTKHVVITNFGIRFRHEFFQKIRKNCKLEISFVINGALIKSKFSICENYSIFNDKKANNEHDIVKFKNISFYEDYYILSSPLDIYVSDSSKSVFKHNIIACNRINDIHGYNSDPKKYKAVYKENSFLKSNLINKNNYLSRLEKIKRDDLIPNDEKLDFNEKIIKIKADFWTRYYDSLKLHYKHKDHLKQFKDIFCFNILEHNLEHEYDGLCDYADTKIDLLDFKDSKTVYGEFIMKLSITEDDKLINDSKQIACLPTLCVIRLYIIKAFNLKNTKNPYIEVLCKRFSEYQHVKFSSTEHNFTENVNPEFGELFEFQVVVPNYFQIEVRVLDKSFHKFHHNHLIGFTLIELENRLSSKFRALSGIPILYYVENTSEDNKRSLYYSTLVWRDILKPSEILKKTCDLNKLTCVFDFDNLYIELDKKNIGLNNFNIDYLDELYVATTNIFEQLCLNVLNTEFNLVKEHIETRTLYKLINEKMIETGKIHLWVDVFPIENYLTKTSLPSPIDIHHRKPVSLELRCIVWSLMVFGNNSNKMINETKNIFIKSWIQGYENQTQKTDTHFHCRNKANFNYRFVFEFNYLWQEKCLLSDYKSSQTQLTKTTPKLHFQILTSDLLSVHSNIIGSVEFDLNRINLPTNDEPKSLFGTNKKITRNQANSESLFRIGKISGWWPCETLVEDMNFYTNMSIEILNSNEVKLKPVGKGRADPNINPKLDEPEREPLFDIGLLNPYHKLIQFLKYILFKKKKKFFFYIFLLIFILLCIWSIPSALINRIVTRVI